MASKNEKNAREAHKKNAIRVIAIVACAALLLTAILPYLVSAIY